MAKTRTIMIVDSAGRVVDSYTPKRKPAAFDTMEEAFNYCRERNVPVLVGVQGKTWKLYPSGKARETK
jgi:hypothetical protein